MHNQAQLDASAGRPERQRARGKRGNVHNSLAMLLYLYVVMGVGRCAVAQGSFLDQALDLDGHSKFILQQAMRGKMLSYWAHSTLILPPAKGSKSQAFIPAMHPLGPSNFVHILDDKIILYNCVTLPPVAGPCFATPTPTT